MLREMMTCIDLKLHLTIMSDFPDFGGESVYAHRQVGVLANDGVFSVASIRHVCPSVRCDYKIKTFLCSEQLRVMAFAQLTYRESLRDIETCLRAVKAKRYHMGIRSGISRNNLSNANQTRDWRIYADFAQVLIGQARALYAEEELGIDLQATVYALDASTIDLCLSMFPWAKFRKAKGAVKIHTLLNLQGSIPEFILISDGKLHDVNALDYLIPMPGAY